MTSKRLPAPPTLFPDPDELDELAAADEACFLKELAAFRERNFRGRFTELDYALNLKSGGVARIFKGERTLDHRRLLRMIRLSGEDPERFFSQAVPSRYPQSAPIGLLPRLIERDPRTPPPAWRDRLLAWAETVEISSDGRSFDFDPEELPQIRCRCFAQAQRAGITALEYFMVSSSGTLAASSVIPLARWITDLGYMCRIQGDRSTSADLFDLALRLESQKGNDSCRSLVLRNTCYLLSDCGHLIEAERFAQKAIDLAGLAVDLPGLGMSHYALGFISTYRGQTRIAEKMFRACLGFLSEEHLEPRALASQSLAMILLDREEPVEAKGLLEPLSEDVLSQISQLARAKISLARGELESQIGNQRAATIHFASSARDFEEVEAVSEIATVGLFELRHSLRFGRRDSIEIKAKSLLKLANMAEIDEIGRAILIEIARLCYCGSVSIESLAQTLSSWRSRPSASRSH